MTFWWLGRFNAHQLHAQRLAVEAVDRAPALRTASFAEKADVLRRAHTAPEIVMLFSDERGRRIAGEPSEADGRFAAAASTIAGLHALDVPFGGGTVRLVPDPRRIFVIAGALVLIDLSCGIPAAILGRRAVRRIIAQSVEPLIATTAALERLADGDSSDRRVAATQSNEVGRLAVAYNRAAASLARTSAERDVAYTGMRRFVADAGHELRTPLAVIIGYVDALRDDVVTEPAERRAILETIALESGRLRDLVNGLIRLARLDEQPPLAPAPVSLREIVDGVLEGLPVAWRERLRDDGGDAYASIAPEWGTAIVRNLIDNAARYTSGLIAVRVGDECGTASLSVSDDGPGMNAEEAERAFDRFYRARREAGEDGSGLGLSIVKRAVETAGGSVTIETSPDSGTLVAVRFG